MPDRGDKVREYELLGTLGRGTFGTVWKAQHQTANLLRAIKIANDPALVEQFSTEFEQLDRLDHAHIVRVYDLIRADDTPAIILEYVAGRDLERALKHSDGRLPWRPAVRIALETLEGLEVAHAAGLLHRDIKPSNLLIAAAEPVEEGAAPVLTADGDWCLKIGDFGLVSAAERTGSVDFSQRTATTRGAGTPPTWHPRSRRGAGLSSSRICSRWASCCTSA